MTDNCCVVEHDYNSELKENKLRAYKEGYIAGRNRETERTCMPLKNAKAGYFVQTAPYFIDGYNEGLKVPFSGKLKIDYKQGQVFVKFLLERGVVS